MGNCLERQRKYRARVANAPTKRYEKTKPGFLMRLYRNMYSRVSGIQREKYHLYRGLGILPRQEFYDWANSSPEFHELWDEWVASGHQRRLTPSVDRVNTDCGYCVENMEWVPFHENCRRANRNREKKSAKPVDA